ncbi:MAG: T9SS type A sorting domain-containing protein [Bacteroidetes bacterium]|jgi:hypothetical protein|nr:T9SS type A sorting domain-containing protein [Bacteroidota bacterium]
MKIPISFIFLMILIGHINAQYLVIDDSISGGDIIPFQDTLLSSIEPDWGYCNSINYFVDLNQDSVQDIDFYLECYMGGMGSYYKMYLTTLNDFSIHTDTSYFEHFQFIDFVGQVQDTTRITSVVKKYQLGDTIYKNQCILSTQEKLLYYSLGNDPVCVFNNIDLFLEDTSYIVFEKSNGDLYYLKIFIPYKSTLELIYAKTSDQTFGIDENDLLQNSIYPNPATELINFKKDFDLIEIYNIQGTLLIEKNESYTQNTIDISSLKSGFYIVILKKDSAKYLTKLIKR